MIGKTVKKISSELEMLTKLNISLERALDLIEASTVNLEELLAINTMRECMKEINPDDGLRMVPHPALVPGKPDKAVVCH